MVKLTEEKLANAKDKLNRLKEAHAELRVSIEKEQARIPFGQPNIIGRGDIYKTINRMHDKSVAQFKEIQKQEDKVKMLEEVSKVQSENLKLKDVHVVGKSEFATIGAKTSVNNLDYFRDRLAFLEESNAEIKSYNKTKPAKKLKTLGTKITQLKDKIKMLEDMEAKDKNKVVSEHAQSLIDKGLVTQWQKKPIFYFVKGLKKVALVLNDLGDFEESKEYPAYVESDKEALEKILNKNT